MPHLPPFQINVKVRAGGTEIFEEHLSQNGSEPYGQVNFAVACHRFNLWSEGLNPTNKLRAIDDAHCAPSMADSLTPVPRDRWGEAWGRVTKFWGVEGRGEVP